MFSGTDEENRKRAEEEKNRRLEREKKEKEEAKKAEEARMSRLSKEEESNERNQSRKEDADDQNEGQIVSPKKNRIGVSVFPSSINSQITKHSPSHKNASGEVPKESTILEASPNTKQTSFSGVNEHAEPKEVKVPEELPDTSGHVDAVLNESIDSGHQESIEDDYSDVGQEMAKHEDLKKDLQETCATGLKAIALYDYQAADSDEISFDPDDIITDIEQLDEGWWRGSCKGIVGLFPANYVLLINDDEQK